MFRKPALKTYQRKKVGGASSTSNMSSIVREDISVNKELQPKAFLAFKDSDQSMEYDPFDTTFDRLVRDAKTPPVLPYQSDDLSYNSSSSEEKNSSSDDDGSELLPDPLPVINPKPPIQRRNNKKQKMNEEVETVGEKKLGKQAGNRLFINDESMDENTEPNFKQQKSGKRGRKKKDSKEPRKTVLKTKVRVAGKSAGSTYSEKKEKNVTRSENLKRCSVSLTRVSIPLDKSMAALNLEHDTFNGQQISDEFAVPGLSKVKTPGEFAKSTSTNPTDEKDAHTLKNPIVALTRLNVPQSQPSGTNKNWFNSTPIDRKILRPKSFLRFSPISTDRSMEITNRNKDGSYDGRSLPPEKLVVQSKNSTPKNSKTSKPSNLNEQLDNNSTTNRQHVLSDTPDPEPSGLMFEDTEIPAPFIDSDASVVKSRNKDAIETSTSPLKDLVTDSTGTSFEDLQSPVRAVLTPIVNSSDATATPFKGFTQNSMGSGSIQLIFDGSDKTGASLEEHTQDSLAATENCTDLIDAPVFKGLAKDLQNSLEESANDLQHSLEESVKDEQNISKKNTKDQPNIFEKSANERQNISEESPNGRENISQKIAKNRPNSLEESTKDTSEKLSSDDEWTTIPDSPKGNSSSETIPEITTVDSSKRKFIVQVSSDDNTSCDDIGEFVQASESSSQRKPDSRQESMNFDAENNLKVVTITPSKAKANESSVDKRLSKDSPHSSIQPVVLLSRLSVPIGRSRRIINVKNAGLNSPSDTMKSIQELSSENEDEDVETSANESKMASKLMEWVASENEELQNDMESLKVEDVSENTAEVEESKITKLSEQDLSKGSFRSSMIEVGNTRESSRKKIKVNDSRNELENVESVETSMNESRVEETSISSLIDDSLEDNCRSIQPIVLLTRLNDPIRISNRRKKYRNWGLSIISENLSEKNVTTIEEEPEDLEVTDTAKNEPKKEDIEIEPMNEDNDIDSNIKFNDAEYTKPVLSQATTVSCDDSALTNQLNDSIKEDKIVFLKPGKSWSRSLSLFRQVHSQDDLESLAVGKGKKWRQSVQSILDMQQSGVVQSCIKKNEDDKESRSCYGVRNSTAAWFPGCSQPDTGRVFSQSSVGSPNRFVRRVSIRVVPDCKNSEHYEDSPFLEAYGITTIENRKTLDKRSTLRAPRKTLIYNVHCADVTFESIPKSLNSVTSRDVVLAQCGQDSSVSFDECYPDSYLKQCRKIGEGVFGEVFLYEKGVVRDVIKIIPIEGDLRVNGERQKKFDEILSEIVIAKELNNLRFADTCKTSSFVEVKNIRCVVGKYPPKLIDLWKTYDDEKNSENDCPDMFDKNQLYIVLELGHGGQDLEAFVFQNSSEAHALFIQTALALAVAEEALEFEHRDLHWGNILISRTEDSQIQYKLRDKDISVASKGVKVSVIDFTLSRMSYQGCSIFNDLSLDDDLFAAQGEYQFEIYRLMRQKIENNWQTFEPYTNILWLHYTIDKMITAVRYRRTASKTHKSGIDKLKELKNEILDYKSALDFVTNCDNVTRLQESRPSVSTITSID